MRAEFHRLHGLAAQLCCGHAVASDEETVRELAGDLEGEIIDFADPSARGRRSARAAGSVRK